MVTAAEERSRLGEGARLGFRELPGPGSPGAGSLPRILKGLSWHHPSHLQVCHHLLHLGPADVQEAFDQVPVNEPRSRLRLALGVKRSPGATTVKEPDPYGVTPAPDQGQTQQPRFQGYPKARFLLKPPKTDPSPPPDVLPPSPADVRSHQWPSTLPRAWPQAPGEARKDIRSARSCPRS